MKNRLNKNTIIALLCLMSGLGFTACSDWTENESLDVNVPNIENIDPDVYAKYLESLRNYKLTDHKLVYVWYDNSTKDAVNRSHHLTAMPDSIDVIALMYPDNLTDRELQEMQSVRENKGMKFIFSIGYETIKLEYDNALEEGAEVNEDEFVTFLTGKVNDYLALADKYSYDGISIKYNGKSTLHMTEKELATYTKFQNAYMSPIKSWYDAHNSKSIIFEGKPQNLLDKTILKSCKSIIINAMDEVSTQAMDFILEMVAVDEVPSDRFIVQVSTASLDPSDNKTGYFNYEKGIRAIPQTAIWLAQPSARYKKSGIAIYNVQNDFFNPTLTYPYTRGAINTLNPSPNN